MPRLQRKDPPHRPKRPVDILVPNLSAIVQAMETTPARRATLATTNFIRILAKRAGSDDRGQIVPMIDPEQFVQSLNIASSGT